MGRCRCSWPGAGRCAPLVRVTVLKAVPPVKMPSGAEVAVPLLPEVICRTVAGAVDGDVAGERVGGVADDKRSGGDGEGAGVADHSGRRDRTRPVLMRFPVPLTAPVTVNDPTPLLVSVVPAVLTTIAPTVRGDVVLDWMIPVTLRLRRR